MLELFFNFIEDFYFEFEFWYLLLLVGLIIFSSIEYGFILGLGDVCLFFENMWYEGFKFFDFFVYLIFGIMYLVLL